MGLTLSDYKTKTEKAVQLFWTSRSAAQTQQKNPADRIKENGRG